MRLRETPEQSQLRRELQEYFSTLLPADQRREAAEGGVGGPMFREVMQKLGRDGWLGIGWPTEYGGQGRSIEDQFVFFDEVQRFGLPFPFVTVNTVGPTLMRHGTDEQKREYLPRILAGEISFAIGYSEPSAGTDLAALQTRAVRNSDRTGWVVNGNKVYTSGANTADYVWLAARTDTGAPKHKGISILVVDCDDPGYSWTLIETVGGMSTAASYYTDVQVADADVVGPVNGGWGLITNQLNHERIGLAAHGGRTIGLWEKVLAWARSSGAIDIEWVRNDLARTHAKLEAMRLINWKMTSAVANDTMTGADAGSSKIFGTETHIEVYRTLCGVLGAAGRLRPGSPEAFLAGELEQISRQGVVNTFGGGVNEVLRDMVATTGLGLPRQRRM